MPVPKPNKLAITFATMTAALNDFERRRHRTTQSYRHFRDDDQRDGVDSLPVPSDEGLQDGP